MTRRRSISLVAVALVASAAFGAYGLSAAPLDATAAPPVEADATAVTHWNQVAASTLVAVPGPNGGAPPAFQINMGMTQGAVYDAVNAIGPKQHQPYLLEKRFGAKASTDAAVATAAYDVLSELVSTAPERAPFPGRRDAPADALRRIRSLARSDRRWPLRAAGHRGRARSSRRHAGGEGERRTVRSVSVGAQYRGRTLVAAPECGGGSRSSTRPRGWAASSRSSCRPPRSSAPRDRSSSTAPPTRRSSTTSRISAEPRIPPGRMTRRTSPSGGRARQS